MTADQQLATGYGKRGRSLFASAGILQTCNRAFCASADDHLGFVLGSESFCSQRNRYYKLPLWYKTSKACTIVLDRNTDEPPSASFPRKKMYALNPFCSSGQRPTFITLRTFLALWGFAIELIAIAEC